MHARAETENQKPKAYLAQCLWPKASCNSLRAQVSAEFLVIIAALFVILLAFYVLSQQQFSSINTTRISQQAKNAVDSLSAAAKEVYSQGEGARRRVYVEIPGSYSYANSSVGNRSISLRVLGSDFVRTFDFDVHGQLPAGSGPQWVWVISEGSRVRIGLSLISLNKQSIVVIMLQNSTAASDFAVKNIFTAQVNVSINSSWNNPNAALAVSDTSFALVPDESKTVGLTFTANENAAGFYTGSLSITGTSGSDSDVLSLPVTVEVMLPPSGAPALFIIPSYWNETLMPNDNVTEAFSVCTNSITSVPSVTFSTTAGPAGSWVSGLENLPAMGPDTCVPKIFTLAIPNGTYSGNYTGTITATGSGVPNAVDTVALSIKVGGNLSDILGPLVLNVTRIPQRPFIGDPVTIRALCDDTARGNNTIKQGEIKLDGGSWNVMSATDGAYDRSAENVSYTFYSPAFGQHNATLRCTDSFNNVGPEVAYQFNVMKEILFITKDSGASGPEQDWINWLDTHSSDESLVWSRDRLHRNVVIDSSFDMNRYAIAVLAEDGITEGSVGSQLVTKLTNFAGNGGMVLLVDEALDDPAQDLGIATSSGTHTLLATAVRSSSHYITEGLTAPSNYTIYVTATKIYHIPNYAGIILTTDYDYGSHLTHAQLGVNGRFVTWGPTKPYRFNTNGNSLTVRVFDYTILNSSIGT